MRKKGFFHNCLSKIQFLRKIDHFGQRVTFYYNRKGRNGSRFGGFITLICLSLCLFYFCYLILEWSGKTNLTIISSKIEENPIELINKNASVSHNFTKNTYFPYFVVQAVFPNGTRIFFEELRNYISFEVYYKDKDYRLSRVGLEACYYRDQDIFLDLSPEVIEKDGNTQSKQSMCIKNYSLEMGYRANYSKGEINETAINFLIKLCQNETNESKCKTDEEIKTILRYVVVEIYLPKTIYDFSYPANTAKIIYEMAQYTVGYFSKKIIFSTIAENILYTDSGLFLEEYQKDKFNFNVEKSSADLSFREENDQYLFILVIGFGTSKTVYYRKNQKLIDILAKLGGILSLLYKGARIICSFYNKYNLNNKIINASFSFDEANRNPNSQKKIKFSIFRYIHSKFSKNRNNIYKKSLNFFYEYLDITNIIRKFEEFEKMKKILLDEKQLKLIEKGAKPTIFLEKNNWRKLTQFTFQNNDRNEINPNGNFNEEFFEKGFF